MSQLFPMPLSLRVSMSSPGRGVCGDPGKALFLTLGTLFLCHHLFSLLLCIWNVDMRLEWSGCLVTMKPPGGGSHMISMAEQEGRRNMGRQWHGAIVGAMGWSLWVRKVKCCLVEPLDEVLSHAAKCNPLVIKWHSRQVKTEAQLLASVLTSLHELPACRTPA